MTFNFANDIVNKEAVRLFHACKNTFIKWSRKSHAYCCIKCSDDHFPEDPQLQQLICDGCCEAIHTGCFAESKNSALLFHQGQELHPFRQDDAVFCSVGCFNAYQRISARFQLAQERPPLRQLQVEPLNSTVPPSTSSDQQQHAIARQPVPQTLPAQPPQARFEHAPVMSSAQPPSSHRPAHTQADAARLNGMQALNGTSVLSKRPAPEAPAGGMKTHRPAIMQKRGDVTSPTTDQLVQGVRASLSLVQAMRAAKNAEKVNLERFMLAQQTLQVCTSFTVFVKLSTLHRVLQASNRAS